MIIILRRAWLSCLTFLWLVNATSANAAQRLEKATTAVQVQHRQPENNFQTQKGSRITLGADVVVRDTQQNTTAIGIKQVFFLWKRRRKKRKYKRILVEPRLGDPTKPTYVHRIRPGTGKYLWTILTVLENDEKVWSQRRSFQVVNLDAPVVIFNPPTRSPTIDSLTYGLQPSCRGDPNPDTFDMCLEFTSLSGAVEDWMSNITWAQNRWESVVVGDAGTLTRRDMNRIPFVSERPEHVDDIYIDAREVYIDGKGGVLGAAGPTSILRYFNEARQTHFWRTISGRMLLDHNDTETYIQRGLFADIVLHEMGHVLGIGSLFRENRLFRRDSDRYLGQMGQSAWEQICGGGYLPIEMEGPGGTPGGHFDERCLVDELMTGYLGRDNPLSNLTIASLYDLGYDVDFSVADNYTTNDMRADPNCTYYCPALEDSDRARDRSLQENSGDVKSALFCPHLSQKGVEAATAYGLRLLEEFRAEYRRQRELGELLDGPGSDFVVLGESRVTVFVAENDHIHHVQVEAASNIFQQNEQ